MHATLTFFVISKRTQIRRLHMMYYYSKMNRVDITFGNRKFLSSLGFVPPEQARKKKKPLVTFPTYTFRPGVSRPDLRVWADSGAWDTASPSAQRLATQADTLGNAPCTLTARRTREPFSPAPFLTANTLSFCFLLVFPFGGRKIWMCYLLC